MSFTAKDVKDLREKTGCGMMDCKKALTESNGNMESAVDFLRKKGLAAATKKAGRIAAEGVAYSCLNKEGNIGAVIEVNAETDFVAKNDDFKNFVKICADIVMEKNPSTVDDLLECKTTDNMSVADLVREKILTIGENINIRRFKRFEGVLASYIHADGRIGVLVKFDTTKEISSTDEFKSFAKDVAMQIAAVNPKYLKKELIPAEIVDHERKILAERVINDGSPEKVVEKIVNGRINKFYKEICLLEQPFVKDPNFSISEYTKKTAKELGHAIEIVDFARFEKGEGIEKREDNFADEVANMIK